MTTRSNIAFGIKQARHDLSRRERFQIADKFLGKVGVAEFGKKYPSQLSGGMQQRAAIARALAMNTDILLMDEPFSAIDAKNRVVLQELLLSLWEGDSKEHRKTVVFVTHDIDEAILLSDKIVVLTAHPGTVNEIVQVPFARPRNRAVLVRTKEYGKFRNRLNVPKLEMLFTIILPAALPQIFLGCNQGLSVSFILLTSAEMIGARDGMGYYVKYYSDFGDYTRTITGLLVIGIVVIAVTFLFNAFQKRMLKWKR